jgi:hypothetical protein
MEEEQRAARYLESYSGSVQAVSFANIFSNRIQKQLNDKETPFWP